MIDDDGISKANGDQMGPRQYLIFQYLISRYIVQMHEMQDTQSGEKMAPLGYTLCIYYLRSTT